MYCSLWSIIRFSLEGDLGEILTPKETMSPESNIRRNFGTRVLFCPQLDSGRVSLKKTTFFFIFCSFNCLFEALRPGQQFSSHFGRASWVLPELSNGDEVS